MFLSLAAMAVLGVAACSSGPASQVSQPAAAPQSATAAAKITIAPAGSMPPGPIKITPVSCGKLTAAQQTQFSTTATDGFIYQFTNDSDSLVAAPLVSVNFTSGATDIGSNSTAYATPVSPGQSGVGEVDAVTPSRGGLSLTGCQVMSYSLQLENGIVTTLFAG